MQRTRWAALATIALMVAPFPALAGGMLSGPAPAPGALVGQGSIWLPVGIPDHLPGVDDARAARVWVSGTPLIRMGKLQLAEGQGSEGGGSGRSLDLKLTGAHCRIFVDSNARPYPSNNTLQSLASEFDGKIWPNDTATFGNIVYTSIDINLINIDGPYGIGGYFTPANPNSLYMDCADVNIWGYQIAAHEFQHLIHNQKDPDEELWVNEGCADLAIAIIYGVTDPTLTGHVDGFEATPDNDLTVFQNEMYDYGSAYAFIQYFWDHFGGQSSVRDLVANKGNGIAGIDDTLQSLGYKQTFETFFPDWCVANRINDTRLAEGQYGYKTLAIQVNLAGDYTSPPVAQSATVHRWASDCYRLQGGNGLDLLTEFCGTKGSYSPEMVAFGQNGANTSVEEMRLDASNNGTSLLYSFGLDYSQALLFTPSSTGGNYAFDLRMVDRSAPRTSLLVLPSAPNGLAGWYTVTPKVTLRSNEDGRTFYWWDETPEAESNGTIEPPEGEHTLFFYSVDTSGNRELNRSASFKVDTVLPVTEMTVDPPQPDGTNGWYLHPPRIGLSSEEGAALLYSWDRAPVQNYTEALTAPEGKHRLEFHSVDEAGNIGNTSQLDILVDSVAPHASANITPAAPDGQGGWYRTAPTVELTTDEPSARLLFAWDNSTELTYVRPIQAPQGAHRLYFRARDQAGNNGTLQDLTLRLDSEAPVVTLSVEPRSPDAKNGWYKTRPTITIQLTDLDPSAAAYYAWDDGDFRAYYGPIKPVDGVHMLHYFGRDTRGNSGNESTRVFKVDSTAPVTIVSIDPAGVGEDWYRQAPDITLTNAEGAEIWYWWDGGSPQLYGGPLTADQGEHELGFQSRDAAGNTEKARTLAFRVDTSPPEAVLTASATSLIIGDIVGLDASRSSDNNGIESYSIDFGDGVRKTGSDRSWEHQYDAPGTYAVTLKVKDVSGQWSSPVQENVTVSLPPRPPAAPAPAGWSPPPALLAGVVIGVLAAVAAVALVRRRRSGRPE